MSRRILLAEDEEFIARLYKKELERHDTEVFAVHNGQEAIDVLRTQKMDLVLLDLLMPDVDGYAVLSYCKANTIRIPVVVVLTNLSGDISRKKCRELGAEDYIVKSDTDAAGVWEKVRKFLPVS